MLPCSGTHLLLLLVLCDALYSGAVSLPAVGAYSSIRPTRHADGLFTSGYSKLLGQLSARRYLESLIGKRISDDLLEDESPVKRHSDAVFTDNFSRLRKQMAVKKYLDSVLVGKRSNQDYLANFQEESTRSEPSFQDTLDNMAVDEFLSRLPVPL
ncbi:VIP peptides-like [Brienomyrus brachyistius]|uniref:VIP peptides-like n=1 Tax=Brienomyrus brachyistius TaxID=42636 RepID=UPI0020B388FC|nr:VIP peptides-like [Brienomyrus brachyistius]